MKTKIITKHSKDCWMVKNVKAGRAQSPWSGLAKRSTLVGKRRVMYQCFSCNDPECEGEIGVTVRDVAEALSSKTNLHSKT